MFWLEKMHCQFCAFKSQPFVLFLGVLTSLLPTQCDHELEATGSAQQNEFK